MLQRTARSVCALAALMGFSAFAGPAFAGYGDLFVSQRNGGSGVVRVEVSTGTVLGTFAGSNASQGVQFGPNGNLFVASFGPDAVFQYDRGSGAQVGSGAFSSGSALGGASGITFGPDGGLYTASFFGNSILKFNGTTGAFDRVFATGVSSPYGITFGPDGNLYVGDTDNDRIERYNGTTGAKIDTFFSSPMLDYPGQFAFGPDGNLYIASFGTDRVIQVDAMSGAVLNASFVSLAGATGLAFGSDGSLYVGSFTNGTVGRYNAVTGAFVGLVASGLTDGPTFMTLAPVPEPASIVLTVLGSATLLIASRRRSLARRFFGSRA